MRGPGLLMLLVLVGAAPAWAQDPQPSPESTRASSVEPLATGPSAEALLRRDDELARLRGRGTMRAVIGGVMLGFGLILGGVSTVLWTGGQSSTSYYDSGFSSWYQGAIAMDTIAFALVGGGTALLAIGAGNISEAKRPQLFIGAASVGAHF